MSSSRSRTVLAWLALFIVGGGGTSGWALPKKGNFELRLSPPSLSGLAQGIGYFDVDCDSCSRGSEFTTVTFLSGAGYFLSDRAEIGFTLDVLYGRVGAGGSPLSGYGVGVGPFFRWLQPLSKRVAFSPEIGTIARVIHGALGSRSATMGGIHAIVRLPFEFFLGQRWSLRVGPGYQLVYMAGSNAPSVTLHGVVLNWSIAVYI